MRFSVHCSWATAVFSQQWVGLASCVLALAVSCDCELKMELMFMHDRTNRQACLHPSTLTPRWPPTRPQSASLRPSPRTRIQLSRQFDGERASLDQWASVHSLRGQHHHHHHHVKCSVLFVGHLILFIVFNQSAEICNHFYFILVQC